MSLLQKTFTGTPNSILAEWFLFTFRIFEQWGLKQNISPYERVFGGLWKRNKFAILRNILQAPFLVKFLFFIFFTFITEQLLSLSYCSLHFYFIAFFPSLQFFLAVSLKHFPSPVFCLIVFFCPFFVRISIYLCNVQAEFLECWIVRYWRFRVCFGFHSPVPCCLVFIFASFFLLGLRPFSFCYIQNPMLLLREIYTIVVKKE